ncbi:DUF6053 domain-containing protein [Lysobacter enzymogenes]|uniref:DUF6053 domain-containing protein n=1 Tax=Lysobacter enzymogenes TaxID=69 RepID=UPI003CCE42BA
MEANADFVGGPSGPRLLFQIAATWAKGVGPEGPPTTARGPRNRAEPPRPRYSHTFGGGPSSG